MSLLDDFTRLLDRFAAPTQEPPAKETTATDEAAAKEAAAREAAAATAAREREQAEQEQEEEARQRIASYPRDHWKPLLDLIPEIEAMAARGERFSTVRGGEREHWWSLSRQLPWIEPAPIVDRFRGLVHELGGFLPYPSRAAPRPSETDVFTICERFSALIRSERMHEEALADAFETGLITEMLKAMARRLG
jgi:hypothetical protein